MEKPLKPIKEKKVVVPKTPKAVVEKKDLFQLELAVSGSIIKSESTDLIQALQALKPTKFTTKGVLTVNYQGKSFTAYLMVPMLKRITLSRIGALIFSKKVMNKLNYSA